MSYDRPMYEPPWRALAKFDDGRPDEELLLRRGQHVKPTVNVRDIQHPAFQVICPRNHGHVCAVMVEHTTRPAAGEDDMPWVLEELLLPGIPRGMQLVTSQGLCCWLAIDIWPGDNVGALCACGQLHSLSLAKLRDFARCHPLLSCRSKLRALELSRVTEHG